MKPQDIVFIVITCILIAVRNPRLFVIAGLLSLVAAVPLFAGWIFFTAERLTWYAAAWFFLGIILMMRDLPARNASKGKEGVRSV